MWIDHEHDDCVLYLNADLFTAAQEREITKALQHGGYTARELVHSLVPAHGS